MSQARPRPPRYAAVTRRLALVRVGVPTLVVCVLAGGPAMTTVAGAALGSTRDVVARTATEARPTVDAPTVPDARRSDAPGDRPVQGH